MNCLAPSRLAEEWDGARIAFALLMVAEAALGLTLFGETLPHWLASLTHPPRLWGLISQILFALTPWAVVRMGVR